MPVETQHPRTFLTLKVRLYRKEALNNADYYGENFTSIDVAKITAYYKRKMVHLITRFTIFHQGGQIFGFSYDSNKYPAENVASPEYVVDEGIEINNLFYYVSGIILYNSDKNINI